MQEMHYTTMHYNAPCIILNKTTGFLLLHQRLLSSLHSPSLSSSLFFFQAQILGSPSGLTAL